MQEQVELWLAALTEKSNTTGAETKYILEPGRKYTRVVRQERWLDSNGEPLWGANKSVHAFIDENGDIYKAASWKAPAKNGARFNVVNDIQRLVEVCDPYGSYLYKR